MSSVFQFIEESSLITMIVLCWLSIYCFAILWIFLYKYISLAKMVKDEQESLEAILQREQRFPRDAIFINVDNEISSGICSLWKNKVLKHSTTGLAFLSIVASTSPFIGLFGTVVEILDAFGRLGGNGGQISFDIIAPIISKALIVTAVGILTAIPAYTFFMIIKRKVYDLSIYVQMQIDYLLSVK